MTILVTGGAGFIGANFVPDWNFSIRTFTTNRDSRKCSGTDLNVMEVLA